MKLARHRGANTMAITDATLSEVAKMAQIPPKNVSVDAKAQLKNRKLLSQG